MKSVFDAKAVFAVQIGPWGEAGLLGEIDPWDESSLWVKIVVALKSTNGAKPALRVQPVIGVKSAFG